MALRRVCYNMPLNNNSYISLQEISDDQQGHELPKLTCPYKTQLALVIGCQSFELDLTNLSDLLIVCHLSLKKRQKMTSKVL